MTEARHRIIEESSIVSLSVVRRVLTAHGFDGEFEVYRPDLSGPLQLQVVFTDPKDKFIYELRGGDAYFSDIILEELKESLKQHFLNTKKFEGER